MTPPPPLESTTRLSRARVSRRVRSRAVVQWPHRAARRRPASRIGRAHPAAEPEGR
jgi:hypothetical protein